MYAAEKGNTDVMKILLEYGADIKEKDNYGQIIIVIIIHYFHTD